MSSRHAILGALLLASACTNGVIEAAAVPAPVQVEGPAPATATTPTLGTEPTPYQIPKDNNPPKEPAPAAAKELGVGQSGFKRLTRAEYDATVKELLGDTSRSGFSKLPEDASDPFDNDYRSQQISGALIEAVETLATNAAARVLADPAKRATVIGCTPTSASDQACLLKFITTFGRRALRRPLDASEIDGFATLATTAAETPDFNGKVSVVLRAMLQDPEFLYRVERGAEIAGKPGVFKLNGFELATRLSYFLLGTSPGDALLDLAAAGKLETPAQVRAAGLALLADPRARAQVDRFHALWLGYSALPHPAALTANLRTESGALVQKMVFDEKHDYFDLFRSTKTFLNDELADHYGLPRPNSATPVWVDYGASPRRGILSHGTVLSAGAKFSDTSPTLRGLFIRNRLFCEEIGLPPASVNPDVAPTSLTSRCKPERYSAHANIGSCFACHSKMDPIGFGLENYDTAGRFRAVEAAAPECSIKGDGEVLNVGKFNGPAGLGEMVIQSGKLEGCVVRQVYRFAMGRREAVEDTSTLADLTSTFKSGGRAFDGLLLDIVASNAFVNRVND